MAEKETLLWQLGASWGLVWLFLADLTDAECLWEPTHHVWSVRPDDAGAWRADFSDPEPDPCPWPTIGWLTWHIGWWWSDVHGRCFGSGGSGTADVVWPGSAEAARVWLSALHVQWRDSLAGMAVAAFDAPVRTHDSWPLNGCRFGQVAAWANIELMKNAAEIGCARRVYANRGSEPLPLRCGACGRLACPSWA